MLLSLAALGAGCSPSEVSTDPIPGVAPSVVPSAVAIAPSPSPAPVEQADPYTRALELASNAITLGRAAQSQDDWRLAVSRWQQAIQLMQSVPADSPNRASAQSKLGEYRRNLAIAQQQANRGPGADAGVILSSVPSPSPSGNGARPSTGASPSPGQSATANRATTASPGAASPANSASAGDTFRVPIVRRAGGTPVVSVTFNGSQAFDMILDTGASGTLITQRMADALSLRPNGQTIANTANARNVAFPLGTIESMEAGGLVARNVPVAIAGPDLNIGLLGNDFFGSYDVVIRQNEVEFRAR